MHKQLKAYNKQAVTAALQKVVAYLWRDEEKDYRSRALGDRDGHIFEQVKLLGEWLEFQHELEQYERRERMLLAIAGALIFLVIILLPEILEWFGWESCGF